MSPLRKFEIFNSAPERKYDNITELAVYFSHVPLAIISLVREGEKYIKSQYGDQIIKDSGLSSFCNAIIKYPGQFIEIKDSRIVDEVSGETKTKNGTVLYYGGYVIQDKEGNGLGTLAVLDYHPNNLNNRQKNALIALGEQVESLLELRLKNNELRDSRRETEKNNALLKNFAGIVSHDLKMPLSSVFLTVDILKTKYADALDEKAIEYLDRLKQTSKGMSDYITNILHYYESDNIEGHNIHHEPFGFNDFLEEIIDMLNISGDVTINMPDKNKEIQCNKDGLKQIFLNLMGNSLKYNDKSKTIIDIGTKENSSCYFFSIKDNGIGIPVDKQKEVFELFSTAAETDRHGKKGNGIGLSTVKKLVNKLGGKITVNSEEGKYTQFNFTIKKQSSQKQKSA